MGAGTALAGGGDALSLISSMKGAGQAGTAAGQDTAALNQIIGTDTGAINKLIQSFFAPGGGQSMISGLANWKGLKPGELSALETTLGNQTSSSVKTNQANMGGVANPGVVAADSTAAGKQNALNLGTQLGGMAQEQELGALTSAAGLSSGLFQGGLSNLGGIANMYSNAANQAAQNQSTMKGNAGQAVQQGAGLFTGGAGLGF